MSPYLFLALAAVFLFLIVLVILGLLIKSAVESLVKGYIARRHYDLIDREFDRNPNVRLNEINEARRYFDGDLPPVQPAHPIDDDRRPPLPLIDDSGFPSSSSTPEPLPARTKPDG
ncbi:MAG: hypothetical protein QOJ06_2188 [Pseudonocardiales bacterium]|nr:hypothetical protein [Pseudonocardiales bacterium]